MHHLSALLTQRLNVNDESEILLCIILCIAVKAKARILQILFLFHIFRIIRPNYLEVLSVQNFNARLDYGACCRRKVAYCDLPQHLDGRAANLFLEHQIKILDIALLRGLCRPTSIFEPHLAIVRESVGEILGET